MIKVTLGEVKLQEEKPFPKLMQHEDGSIWYFVSECYGLPFNGIWDLNNKELAEWSNMIAFTDYNEPVTIQNA